MVQVSDTAPDIEDVEDVDDYTESDTSHARNIHQDDFDAGAGSGGGESKPVEPLAKFTPYPVDLLPDTLAALVSEAADAINCDGSNVALPLLTCAGAAIGNTHRIQVKKKWVVPPTVWSMVIAESGTAKSPGQDVACEAAELRELDLAAKNEAARSEYEIELEQYAAEKQERRKSKASDPPPEKPEEPGDQRALVKDITVESLATVLRANPRGVVAVRDELSGFFGGMNRYNGGKGGDESYYLSMFDGRSLTVDRKTGDKRSIHIRSALLSVTGGIQPGIFSKVMTKEHRESGMASRFLFAMPPRRSRPWSEDEVSDETDLRVADLFNRLYMLDFADGISQPHIVTMSPEAKEVWVEFHDQCDREAQSLYGDESSAWAKLSGYAPRIALLFHVVKQTANWLPTTDPIDAPTMIEACSLVEWHKNEALRVYAMIDDDAGAAELRQYADWIVRRYGGEATPAKMATDNRKLRPVAKAEELAMKLVKCKLAEWHVYPPGESGGRPKRVIRILQGS